MCRVIGIVSVRVSYFENIFSDYETLPVLYAKSISKGLY